MAGKKPSALAHLQSATHCHKLAVYLLNYFITFGRILKTTCTVWSCVQWMWTVCLVSWVSDSLMTQMSWRYINSLWLIGWLADRFIDRYVDDLCCSPVAHVRPVLPRGPDSPRWPIEYTAERLSLAHQLVLSSYCSWTEIEPVVL